MRSVTDFEKSLKSANKEKISLKFLKKSPKIVRNKVFFNEIEL